MTQEKRCQLRGLIYSIYKSEAEMARQMGWNRQRLNKITTGNKMPDIIEINALAKALDTNIEKLIQIILPEKLPSGQQNMTA